MQATRGTPLSGEPDGIEPPGEPIGTTRPSARLLGVFSGVALLAYLVDVGTKQWAVTTLTADSRVPLVGDLLTLTLVRNPGAAFSTATGLTPLLSLLAAVAIVVVLVLSRRLGSRLWAVGLGLLLAGVSGNFTDRLIREPGPFRGHVIDMLRLPNWPVFNVADICINLAAAVIIVQAVRGIGINGQRHSDETSPT
ncbi:MAG: signal peptidase II [Nocardioides sp.]